MHGVRLYAGSGASLYSVWDSFFGDDIEICPVQLPGRENRRREQLCSDIQGIAGSIAEVIAGMADVPFSVFGYSMGGVIAYETVLKLKAEHNIVPQYLFMGASSVFSDRTEVISELDDDALISYLRSIGNSSEDVFGDNSTGQRSCLLSGMITGSLRMHISASQEWNAR